MCQLEEIKTDQYSLATPIIFLYPLDVGHLTLGDINSLWNKLSIGINTCTILLHFFSNTGHRAFVS